MKTVIIRHILEYLLIFCIILEFNTPYLIFPEAKRIIQILPIILLLTLLLISNFSIKKRTNTQVFVYLIGALFPMLILREHNYFAFIMRYVLILPLLWLYLNQRKELGFSAYCSLFLKFSNVVFIIAIISLLMWFLCSILQIVPPTAYFPYEWAPNKDIIPSYWGIYFETQYVAFFGEQICRNSGIFNEAPMYNMILCTAFIIEYFIRPIQYKIRLWILAITIVTTFTTTGQFFLISIGMLYIFKKIGKQYRILLILVIPIFAYGGYIMADKILQNKVEAGGGGEASMDLRSEDIEYCLEAGMENPMLGVGLILKEGESTWNGTQLGRSNSLFAVFARGGLYSLVLYVGALLIIPYLYYRKNKDSHWFYTMLYYFLIFSITISFLKYLTFLFIAWGLSNLNLKRWQICSSKATTVMKK